MKSTKYDITLRLKEHLLGTVPHDKEVYATYIASKAADLGLQAEEVETVESLEAKGHTGFHNDEEGCFLYDYAIKGFLKEAATAIKQWKTMKQLRSKIATYVYVRPRRIRIAEISHKPLERPLRAQTPMGPRVALARSDYVQAGAALSFQLEVLDCSGIGEDLLKELLSFGEFTGLGQWRSASFGSFTVEKLEEI